MSKIALSGRCAFVSVGHMRAAADWSMKAHRHLDHEMIVTVRGRQYVTIGGEELAAEAGEVLFYPARVAHAERTDGRKPHESLFLSFRWGGYRPGMPLKVADREGRMAALARWLYGERDAVHRASAEARGAFVSAIVAEYLRLISRPAGDVAGKVRAYVRAHLDEPLALGDLARCAGLSKFHFLRVYKRLTGMSPMGDVRRIRLEEARSLLLSTDLPLKAVAPRVGLANEYHLSRLLKKHLGAGARDLRQYPVPGARP